MEAYFSAKKLLFSTYLKKSGTAVVVVDSVTGKGIMAIDLPMNSPEKVLLQLGFLKIVLSKVSSCSRILPA